MDLIKAYNRIESMPFGKALISYMVCRKIPYFFSIRPSILELTEGRAVVQMKERRSVHNHLRTVHAIALCNLCEFAMAVVTEATIPRHLRFIPVGMKVEYKRKAKGILRGITEIRKDDFKSGNVDIPIDVFDEENVNVMSAVITLNIKEKKQA